MKKSLMLLSLIIIALLPACSKEIKRQSEDSRLAVQALGLVEEIRSSYVRKDFEIMGTYFAGEGFGELKKDFPSFDSVEVKFTPEWVEVEGDAVFVDVLYEGRWRSGDIETEGRGTAVFELSGSPLRVTALKGNPFKPTEPRFPWEK